MTARSVLLIDDDRDIMFSFKSILESEGYLVYTASDADEALDIVEDEEVNYAIMDFVLPNVRGDQLARLLKRINEKINIIFVTGYFDVLDAVKHLDFSVCDVLMKPIDPGRLVKKLDKLSISAGSSCHPVTPMIVYPVVAKI
ncbi:MAG: response regulator [Candidatus Bathyarchaeota archaeon]|nr:response regulator [Candidatus Bathyarchaeota archaeon]